MPLVNRHPNTAFFGGTVIMVMAAFANVANACHHNAETAEQTSTAVSYTHLTLPTTSRV